MSDHYHLRLHADCRARVDVVGVERSTVIVLDNFLQEAEKLVDYAATNLSFQASPNTHYPGVRAPMPDAYKGAAHAFLGKMIRDVFGLGPAPVTTSHTSFAMMTLPPEQAEIKQRIPHVDSTTPNIVFLLHYLCRDGDWGTSFYRHRKTGFEMITPARGPDYYQTLESELMPSPPTGYINGDTPLFENIARYDAVFNRALIYRSACLHSGNIGENFPFATDPRHGRLTANSAFLFPPAP